jgi:hypothetical protein
MRELPPDAFDPDTPPGTPPAAAVAEHMTPWFCAHGVKYEFHALKGGFLPDVAKPDVLHKNEPIPGSGALHAECQPARVPDPKEYPDAWPDGVKKR